MGNAHAASWGWSSAKDTASDTTPTPPLDPPLPEPQTPPPQSTPVDAPPPSNPTLTNSVGTFEEIHKPCKDISLQPFEGLRFMVNKGLSSHFQAQHTVHLNNEGSSYKFGSTYVGSKQPSPTEAYPVMIGEMSNEGNLQAQFIHQCTSRFKAKCIAQTQGSKLQSVQIGGDVVFKDSTISFVCADPDLLNGSGMLILHYLQGITPKLAIGSELLYQRGAARQQAIVTVAGRYKTDTWQAAGTLAMGGIHASFYRKANENVQVGVELEASLKNKESVTTFAYQMDLPKMNLMFKGMLTSEWTIGSSLEKRLQPLPITLNLTGTYNIKKDKVAVGIGAMLG